MTQGERQHVFCTKRTDFLIKWLFCAILAQKPREHILKFWSNDIIILIRLKMIINESWSQELIFQYFLASLNKIYIIFKIVEKKNIYVAFHTYPIFLVCYQSLFKVIHFKWYTCEQLLQFRQWGWLWTRLSQVGEHVMVVMTDCT